MGWVHWEEVNKCCHRPYGVQYGVILRVNVPRVFSFSLCMWGSNVFSSCLWKGQMCFHSHYVKIEYVFILHMGRWNVFSFFICESWMCFHPAKRSNVFSFSLCECWMCFHPAKWPNVFSFSLGEGRMCFQPAYEKVNLFSFCLWEDQTCFRPPYGGQIYFNPAYGKVKCVYLLLRKTYEPKSKFYCFKSNFIPTLSMSAYIVHT